MAASYLPYESQQQRLLPDALQDWLPEGHLAYFISDSVYSLDLSAFHARYASHTKFLTGSRSTLKAGFVAVP